MFLALPALSLPYGSRTVTPTLPDDIRIHTPRPRSAAPAYDALGVVARALDAPVGALPLAEAARRCTNAAVVVPDGTRAAPVDVYLLPVLARLAQAGLAPDRIRVVIARGIHRVMDRDAVAALVGTEVMDALRPVQSAPDAPEWNVEIHDDPRIGPVHVHRQIAEADLVVLTGRIQPHHLAGWAGGAKALVPGVAARDTVLAAHRLTLDALVRPNGSIRPASLDPTPNVFREALLRIAERFRRTYLLNVVTAADGRIADAVAGDVRAAHAAGIERWRQLHDVSEPTPSDLVVVATPPPRDGDLIQAHKSLLEALAWAKPNAPIVWLAPAWRGPGHPAFLPWFEAGKLPRHLAALRERFHPYGLTAYSIRRIAKVEHPVHVVSEITRDVLRPMGLLPFQDAQKAIDFAMREAAEAGRPVRTCAVLGSEG